MEVLVGGEQGCRPAAEPSRESWLQGVKGPCGASGCGAEELPCVSDGSCGAFPPRFVISSMGLLVRLCSYPPKGGKTHEEGPTSTCGSPHCLLLGGWGHLELPLHSL